MAAYNPSKLAGVFALAEIIVTAGQEMEKEMHKRREARRPRIKRGATLRPSDDTPLWNALVSLAGPDRRVFQPAVWDARRRAHAPTAGLA